MRISRIRIENFRSIRALEMGLGEATVLIGQNNAGKTAILDAVRTVLTRRWGQRGTGFTENDVHRPGVEADPRALPPVKIVLVMEESHKGEWDEDMIAALDDIMSLLPDGRNIVTVQVICAWSEEKESFDPVWQFLNHQGDALPERRRAINLTGFFNYMPLFWLGPLRDAASEFTPRSGHWGRLLRSVHIPPELEEEVMQILADLDARIVEADPKLTEIADMIGQATRVAIGEGPGSARLNTLPLTIEDMLERTGIVLRNEDLRPWLPLGHHGQGLQSLAVIFLFQAAVLQQLEEAEQPGIEPIFAIEEPEAHLHPQAARTLWDRIQELSGQKLMTTHSPFFVQHVPLRDIRLVRLNHGCTEYSCIPPHIVSNLPWNGKLDALIKGSAKDIFFRHGAEALVAARSWFDETMARRLRKCYDREPERSNYHSMVDSFRHECRILPTIEDENQLGFHGRRVRGEIFFARRWLLVEGITEYLLVHALGDALDWQLDSHGLAVIDFKQSGNAGIYPALAEAFNIPWHMIVDGDQEADKFKQELTKRGFVEDDLNENFETLDVPNSLEDQLIADGHEPLLRTILAEISTNSALNCSLEEFVKSLKNNKASYMKMLSSRVREDASLARTMPTPFVNFVTHLKDSSL